MATKVVLFAMLTAVLSLFFSCHAPDSERVEVIPLEGVTGPESLAFDTEGGGPYTGVSNGDILKWEPEKNRWIRYAVPHTHLFNDCRRSQGPSMEHECGRPLGLEFNLKTGELYIADAYLGLLVVGPNDTIAFPVAFEANDQPFRFTNGLYIDQTSGLVYFTDSSMHFQRREFMAAVIAGDKTGRLMKYDPHSEQVEVLQYGLSFPNGVALSKDGSFLVIAETTTCRILRYWLRPPKKAGTLEVLLELPGFPDNIKRSPRGGFWVAMHSKRSKPLKRALSHPWLATFLSRLSSNIKRMPFFDWFRGKALAVRFSEEGDVLERLEGFGGRKLKFISEVEERNGSLWVGSVQMPFVGLYKHLESDQVLKC